MLTIGKVATASPLTTNINLKAAQANPTTSQIVFAAVVSSPFIVSTFIECFLELSCTTTDKNIAAITHVTLNKETTFKISLTAISGGSISIAIPAAKTLGTFFTFSTSGLNPCDVNLDTLGNGYLANSNFNNAGKITPAGISSIFGKTGRIPFGITVDRSADLYTANYSSRNVSKIEPLEFSSIIETINYKTYQILPI